MREKAASRAAAGKRTTPVVLKNRKREWSVAVLVFALLFLFVWQYHYWRGWPYGAESANKAVAISAVLFLCAALSLGPLDRLAGGLPRLLRLRRPFGVTGAILAALELDGVVTLAQVPELDRSA